MSDILSNRQSTATPKLTKTQLELLQVLALPTVTHLCEGFRGAFIGGGTAGRKSFRNETAKVLMGTAYLTRFVSRGTGSGYYYRISPLGLEYLASRIPQETK